MITNDDNNPASKPEVEAKHKGALPAAGGSNPQALESERTATPVAGAGKSAKDVKEQASQVVPVSAGLYQLEFLASPSVGPDEAACLARLHAAGEDLRVGLTPKLPNIGSMRGQLVAVPGQKGEPSLADKGKYGLDYGGSDMVLLVGECRQPPARHISTHLLITSEMCAWASLPVISANAAELIAAYAGPNATMVLYRVRPYIDLHGVRAEVFFEAFKHGKFACQAKKKELIEGRSGHLYFGPEPVELFIENTGDEKDPESRISLRVSEEVLGEDYAVVTTDDLVKRAEDILEELTTCWCQWTESGHPHAPMAPLWSVVSNGLVNLARQLVRTHGQELVFRSKITAERGVPRRKATASGEARRSRSIQLAVGRKQEAK